MKQRLQTLLATEKIASSKFADIIGVNRSSISHLLSGRNNPGLDFLQKVLVKFPHINPDWLLLGQGSMYRNAKDHSTLVSVNRNLFEETPDGEAQKEPRIDEREEPLLESKPMPREQQKHTPMVNRQNLDHGTGAAVPKQTERIVFFYKDGTFDTYTPSDNQKD